MEWFRNRTEATVVIRDMAEALHEDRPHSSLRYLTPMACKTRIASWQASAVLQ